MKNAKLLIAVFCLMILAMAASTEAVDWSKGGTELFPSAYNYPAIDKTAVDNWWYAQHNYLEKWYHSTGPYAGAWGPDPAAGNVDSGITHPDTRDVAHATLGYIYICLPRI